MTAKCFINFVYIDPFPDNTVLGSVLPATS